MGSPQAACLREPASEPCLLCQLSGRELKRLCVCVCLSVCVCANAYVCEKDGQCCESVVFVCDCFSVSVLNDIELCQSLCASVCVCVCVCVCVRIGGDRNIGRDRGGKWIKRHPDATLWFLL